jgi:cell division protein FtsL
MSNLTERLDAIIDKLRVTLSEKNSVEQEVMALHAQLNAYKAENETLKQKNKDLEENNNIIKLAKSFDLNNDDKEVLKKKLKYYIKEIDKCLLNINV